MRKHTICAHTDDPFIGLALRACFAGHPEFELVTVSRTKLETMAAVSTHRPHLLVCRTHECDLYGLAELHNASPETGLVLWARQISTEVAHQAVAMGVRGFVSATATIETFLECLTIAARGERWMEPSLSMDMLNRQPIHLSKRQSELVALLVQGLKNKEIAAALGISEGTVKAYLTALYEKVGARDRFELAVFGLKNLGELRATGPAEGLLPREPLRSPLRSLVAARGANA